jgi:anti-sigma regulatory factor (Ser/Thr protein kinase)
MSLWRLRTKRPVLSLEKAMRELSLHILDLIENSKDAGARHIEVRVTEDLANDLLVIEVSDDGRGMNEAVAQAATSPFSTSRTTRRVGLGLPLFQAAARRCKGDLVISSREGEGTCVKVWFRHSHIDRAPIGDMAGTIGPFIGSYPTIRFIYVHRVIRPAMQPLSPVSTARRETESGTPGENAIRAKDKSESPRSVTREFAFDSSELVGQLGGDPRILGDPDVVGWIRRHFVEGIRNLYGGEGE